MYLGGNHRWMPLFNVSFNSVACVAGGIVWVRDLSRGSGAVFQKKEVGTRQLVFLAASPLKSHSTILQRFGRQISLDYYTIPPATQAINSVAVPSV